MENLAVWWHFEDHNVTKVIEIHTIRITIIMAIMVVVKISLPLTEMLDRQTYLKDPLTYQYRVIMAILKPT